MTLQATTVFTPGAFPSLTYVARDGEALERALLDAINTPGQIVSLVGPSKSGKTVLVEKVIGRELLITITGAGIEAADDIWTKILDWIGAPASEETTSKTGGKAGAEAGAVGGANFFGLGKAEVHAKATGEASHERARSETSQRTGLPQIVKEIANSDYVVLVDDFHYMRRAVQAEAAKSLKEAVRLGIKVCTASVMHRGDDLVRANPELRGRVRGIDLAYWEKLELREIAVTGFRELNMTIADEAIDALTQEAAGSPQLMQLLCLNACFVLDRRERAASAMDMTVSKEQLQTIFQQTSASTDFRSLVDVLDDGPKTRGTERKLYEFHDGSVGDVYRAVLKAVASNPPKLSFDYEELAKRTAALCVGESPVGSSIVGTCVHISRLAIDRFPNERSIDW